MSNLGPGSDDAGDGAPASEAPTEEDQARAVFDQERAIAAAAKADEDAAAPDWTAEQGEPGAGETPVESLAQEAEAAADAPQPVGDQLEVDFDPKPAPAKSAAETPSPPPPVTPIDGDEFPDETRTIRMSHPRPDDRSTKAEYYRQSQKFFDIRSRGQKGILLGNEQAEMLDHVRPTDDEGARFGAVFKGGGSFSVGRSGARASGLRTLEEKDMAASQIVEAAMKSGMREIRIRGTDVEAKERLYYHARAAGLPAFGFVPEAGPSERKAEINAIRRKMARNNDFEYTDKIEPQLAVDRVDPVITPKPDDDDDLAAGAGSKPTDPKGPQGGGGGDSRRMDVAAITASAAAAPGGLLEAVQETLRGGQSAAGALPAPEEATPTALTAAGLGITDQQAA
ncbi:MAG: hypothetical protein AAF556_08545, partial [Pseudomonadota bacterium]